MSEAPAVERLRKIADGLHAEVAMPVELPEPTRTFNIAKRGGDRAREYKHMHQTCLGHVMHFRIANAIKQTYLVDDYLQAVDAHNPLGVFGASRALLELHAFVKFVQLRLTEAALISSLGHVERGTKFLDIIVRARYGTTDVAKQQVLARDGRAADAARPFHILKCIDEVSHKAGAEWLRPHYEFLCDYVHHNLSSQTLATAAMRVGQVARFGKGAIVTREGTPLVTYSYRSLAAIDHAIEATASNALLSVDAIAAAIVGLPFSPFGDEELARETGSATGGLRHIPGGQAAARVRTRDLGLNAPCPCGSGKKYKRCCGAS